MPQWCLTATGVEALEDNTLWFDVGTEPRANDEAVADACADSFRDLAVEPVDDCDRDAFVVEDSEPVV